MSAHLYDPRPARAASADDSSAELFDLSVVRDWAKFLLGSFGRHKLLGTVCLVLVMGIAGLVAQFMPRSYEASTKILTHQTGFMSSLSNPYRGAQDEGPTRAARERVLGRDNLEKIVAQTDLVNEWAKSRNPVFKLKDRLQQMIGGQWTKEDLTEIMVGTLGKRLAVAVDEGTVEIKVVWPEPSMARRIVESAQQNFLETRHLNEVAAISETIGILEIHAGQTQSQIDEALANLQHVISERTKSAQRNYVAATPVAAPSPAAAPAPVIRPSPRQSDVPSQEMAQLKFLLRSKQRAISDLEEFRTRQLTELRTQLEQQKVIYNNQHPVILELEQRVDSLKKDSPQLDTLKREEAQLTAEIEAKGGNREERAEGTPAQVRRQAPSQPSPAGTAMETSLAQLAPELDRDPTITVAQDQLRVALARYQELLMRVEAARLELDTARAAFKYRFSVVNPPQTPRKPTAPNVPFILLAGLLGGVFLAFLAAAGLDLWRRTVCNTWQIERQINLPVIASVKL
ncbi:MAG: hypothetical protein IPJ65_34715 [Archangiaceae bacterium]|nr:hypothetical protein [Archangiaceae bacterium]